MIRQAISCDICGTEKKQTNHWFVASLQGAELRLSGWNSRNRTRPDSKHLCGQTCLHKLVDDFMARSLAPAPRPQAAEEEAGAEKPAATDTSLTSAAAYEAGIHADLESSARLIPSPGADHPVLAPLFPTPVPVMPAAVPPASMAARPAELPKPPLPEESPSFASRNWRAEAWERERERELRSAERRPDIAARRHSGS